MRIDAEIEENHRILDSDLARFVRDLEVIGVTPEVGDIRMAPKAQGYGFVGPASEIVLRIDPETLRQLFEYGASLVVLYKGGSFVGDFLKKIVQKLGDVTGAKIAAALSRLWTNLWKRIRSAARKQRTPNLSMRLEMEVDGVPVNANMSIDSSHLKGVSTRKEKRAMWRLFNKVLPLLPILIREEHMAGRHPEAAYVTLTLPESILDSYGPDEVGWRRGNWHWHVFVKPGRELIIDRLGRRTDRPS